MAVHIETVEAGIPAGDAHRPYRVRPLSNQVFVRIAPKERNSIGGLILPDALRLFATEKKPPVRATVISVGGWRKTKAGLSILPDISPGQMVLVDGYNGLKCVLGVNDEYRLCSIDDVLAIVEETLDAPPDQA